MPGKKGRKGGNISNQSLWHPFASNNAGSYTAGQVGVLLDRVSRPRVLNIEFVYKPGTGQSQVGDVFNVAVFDSQGQEVARTRPLLASYTIQRVMLHIPASTDFGEFATADKIVDVLVPGTIQSLEVSFSMSLHMEYKPAPTTIL